LNPCTQLLRLIASTTIIVVTISLSSLVIIHIIHLKINLKNNIFVCLILSRDSFVTAERETHEIFRNCTYQSLKNILYSFSLASFRFACGAFYGIALSSSSLSFSSLPSLFEEEISISREKNELTICKEKMF
jgi:hypothetical protein